jgi:predicted nucleotidyltransferase
MPKIKDVKKILPNILSEIKKTEGVKAIYVWGSYVDNFKNQNFRVRDIDIMAKTAFNSGDLISVDENIIKEKISNEDLEDLGYNPQSVIFSKSFLSLNKYNIDHWAISSDSKLLHWGPISYDKKESEEIGKEAAIYASNLTGIERKKINKISQEDRDNWYSQYHKYVNKIFSNMPSGWYLTNAEDMKEIINKSLKI